MDLPLSAAGEPANANHLDTGMLEIGDEFAGPRDDGPALEVASMKPRRESPRPQRAHAEAPRESNAEQRMRRVRDLARYPAVPPKLVGAIPYFLRVYSRRRELAAQVINLTQQRKRLELASDDALCLLGQALYAKRGDPSLEPLAAQLRVVGESAREVGAKAAAAKRTEQELKHELAGLERELLDAKTGADPVQARETVLSQAVDGHKAQIKRREMMVRKADAELKALKVGSDPQTLEKITTLTAEREQHYGELQSLQVKLIPLEEELPGLRATLAKHNAQVESLQERVRRLQGAMGREHGRERIAAGGSHSAYRDALRSVANLALKHELAECAPAEQRAALEAGKLAAATRESEELMRAAVGCYNERAYQRGMQLLVGSTIGVFLLFALLIAL
jgi:chromosome segregation ATPase